MSGTWNPLFDDANWSRAQPAATQTIETKEDSGGPRGARGVDSGGACEWASGAAGANWTGADTGVHPSTRTATASGTCSTSDALSMGAVGARSVQRQPESSSPSCDGTGVRSCDGAGVRSCAGTGDGSCAGAGAEREQQPPARGSEAGVDSAAPAAAAAAPAWAAARQQQAWRGTPGPLQRALDGMSADPTPSSDARTTAIVRCSQTRTGTSI